MGSRSDPPRFRRALESGTVEAAEWTALGLITAFRAAAERLGWQALQAPCKRRARLGPIQRRNQRGLWIYANMPGAAQAAACKYTGI